MKIKSKLVTTTEYTCAFTADEIAVIVSMAELVRAKGLQDNLHIAEHMDPDKLYDIVTDILNLLENVEHG